MVDGKVADRMSLMSLSAGSQKPHFARVVIGCGLTGGATGTTFAGGDC
jgi:hypothetical protein